MNKKNKGKQKDINLIIIVIDALRAQNLSYYGYPKKTSPFIDSLAKSGAVFDNFYSCTDHTDPSFTTIHTGRYSITHGIRLHGPHITKQQINELKLTNAKFLAELLKENNKDMITISIDWLGRWHKSGFDIYGEENILQDKIGFLGKYKWINEKVKSFVNRFSLHWYYKFNGFLEPFGFKCRNDAEAYFNYARYAIEQQATKNKKNFFLHIHLWDVHPPLHLIPEGFVRKFDHGKKELPIEESFKHYKNERFKESARKHHLKNIKYLSEVEVRYNAAINYVDNEISKFVEYLKTKGLWDNTYLIITADHGENLVVDDVYISHGGSFNEVMWIPFIIHGPNISHKRIKQIAQSVDITPTVLDLFNITFYKNYDGESILPLLRGDDPEWREEALFIAGAANNRYTLMNNRFKFNYSPSDEDYYHHGEVWYLERVELFDLKKDPGEKNNIVKEKPEVAELMELRLKQILSNLKRNKERYIMSGSFSKIRSLAAKGKFGGKKG